MNTALGQQVDATVAPANEARLNLRYIYIVCAGIFLLSLAIRIGFVLVLRSYVELVRFEPAMVATSLAKGQGFVNAYGNGAPTAHVSPLYPIVLSLAYRMFGTGIKGEIAQELLACLVDSLTWGLLPLMAEFYGLNRRVGVAAGFFGAVVVVDRWAVLIEPFEASMASLACLLVFTLFLRCWRSRDFSVRTGVLAGIVSGLAMLVSSSLGAVVTGLLIAGYFLFRGALGWKYLRFGFITALLIVVTLFPWALRNRLVLGDWVWTRSNLPLELMVSNDDDARPMFKDNWTAQHKYHPFLNLELRSVAARIGELALERQMRRQVERWVWTHPKQFAWLTLERTFYFWLPVMKRPLQTKVMELLFLSGITGLFLLLRAQQLLGYAILAVWIAYPLVYYLVQVDPRYLYPIQWTEYVLGAYSVQLAFQWWDGRRSRALAN